MSDTPFKAATIGELEREIERLEALLISREDERAMTQPTQAQIEAATDIVKRLRAELDGADHLSDLDLLIADAADEIERLTAAAQVGETKESAIDWMLRKSSAAQDVTIERCAQVVKEWFEKADPQNGANMPTPIALIAAIRKLKDAP